MCLKTRLIHLSVKTNGDASYTDYVQVLGYADASYTDYVQVLGYANNFFFRRIGFVIKVNY